MNDLPDFNQMEIHLDRLHLPKIKITYLGATEVIASFELWEFIVAQRMKLQKRQIAQLEAKKK